MSESSSIIKLISLNVYGGEIFEPLVAFIKNHAQGTDVFCFQEVFDTSTDINESRGARTKIFQEICDALPEFLGFFTPLKNRFDRNGRVGFNLTLGSAIFVNKKWQILNHKSELLPYKKFDSKEAPEKDIDALAGTCEYLTVMIQDSIFTICNYYGLWYPGSKLDTKERLAQIKSLLSSLESGGDYKVILGDFNLLPNTKGIHMIEEAGFINLIKKFNISTTRGSFFKSLRPEFKGKFQEYTDYAFISSNLEILDFQVPDIAISDHLPLIVTIKIK